MYKPFLFRLVPAVPPFQRVFPFGFDSAYHLPAPGLFLNCSDDFVLIVDVGGFAGDVDRPLFLDSDACCGLLGFFSY